MCKVSVLVPIYNVERYLTQCLKSLADQTLEDMEIICLNDGSTDDSLTIAYSFQTRDKRFRVVDKPNSGYGKTMNMGLDMVRGEYVGIVESDDFVEPEMFADLLKIAEENNIDVVKSSYWFHVNGVDKYEGVLDEKRYGIVLNPKELKMEDYRNPSIWSNLYKRSFLEENDIRFLDSSGASFQDVGWRVKIFATAKRVLFIKKAYYHYRRDNMNSSVRDKGKLFCVCDEYDVAEKFLSSRDDWEERYKYLLPALRWGHYYWNCFGRLLTLDSSWIFYKHMQKEYNEYKEAGLLRADMWHESSWHQLQQMFSDFKQFFFEQCVSYWMKCIVLRGFMPLLDEAPKFAIYGAGKVGREAMAVLSMRGKRVDCFVVSDFANNEISIDGVPVRMVDELIPRQSEYVILIAVSMTLQSEILGTLLDKGFVNIVSFLPEVRRALKV